MENKCVIAIDYGTQSVRVSIIDDHGKFLAFEQERYNKPYFSPKPGYRQSLDIVNKTLIFITIICVKRRKDLLKNIQI